ncbi:MAG: hypothetical protein Q4D66_04880 [Bacteroidales bacterium]|nr:hypothetical protein [Bacteroidales bacterium]
MEHKDETRPAISLPKKVEVWTEGLANYQKMCNFAPLFRPTAVGRDAASPRGAAQSCE